MHDDKNHWNANKQNPDLAEPYVFYIVIYICGGYLSV